MRDLVIDPGKEHGVVPPFQRDRETDAAVKDLPGHDIGIGIGIRGGVQGKDPRGLYEYIPAQTADHGIPFRAQDGFLVEILVIEHDVPEKDLGPSLEPDKDVVLAVKVDVPCREGMAVAREEAVLPAAGGGGDILLSKDLA